MCKEKVNRYLVENVELVAYLASFIVCFMAVIMYLTHNEVRLFYAGHEGQKEVNGQIDRLIKAQIDAKTNHVRRLSPEELKKIEKWLNNKKEGRGGTMGKLGADELIELVIDSTHKDDNHDPFNEKAQEFLTKGDGKTARHLLPCRSFSHTTLKVLVWNRVHLSRQTSRCGGGVHVRSRSRAREPEAEASSRIHTPVRLAGWACIDPLSSNCRHYSSSSSSQAHNSACMRR